jgi:predicted ATP-grasp superfamily ATP-dependent carboligase
MFFDSCQIEGIFPFMPNENILLTYCWVRSTYAALRNLSSHGLNVAVADSNCLGMCQLSQLKTGFYQYQSPFVNEQRFVESLIDILKLTNSSMLIPSHEETMIIARHRDAFPKNVSIPIASYKQLSIANDKGLIQQFAQTQGIETPHTILWNDVNLLKDSLNTYNMRWVVKLRRSNSAKGVFYATSTDNVLSIISKCRKDFCLSADQLPIVQEFVLGEGWGVSCLFWEGKPIASFTHRRIREKTLTGGTSTLREHQPNKLIEAMAHKLLSALNWHGLAMVEFKYNPETGKAWFIEINPRLWGSLHLAISAGVEFPYLLYLASSKGPAEAHRYQQQSIVKYPWKARWYLGDCIIAAQSLKKGELSKMFKLLRPGGANTYDDFNKKDILAFIGELLYYGKGFLKSGSFNPIEKKMLG